MNMNDFLNKVSGEVVDVITEFIEDNFDTEDFSEQDMGELTEAINEYACDWYILDSIEPFDIIMIA